MNSDQISVLVLILAGVGAFLFLIASLSKMRLKQKSRSRNDIKAFAKSARMTFYKNSPELDELLKRFEMMQRHNAQVQISNVLLSRSGELSVSLFEFSWITSGQIGVQQKQTAVLFDDFRLSLSHFLLRPRKMGDLLDSLSGCSDVVPERCPEFNNAFRVVGEAPLETHQLLTDEFVEYFLQNQNLCVEGLGNYFLVFAPDSLIAPPDLHGFLDSHLTGYHLLRQAASRSKQTKTPS
ncbi:MAG: hypothetical protein JKY95_05170 [Planctomycetaceae bacterium]|nr:hypothetical protein [Planctomycetaceae bacterium]